jgi:hypothetical protein
MYVCVLGIPKENFSKQMKKNILRYRIIRGILKMVKLEIEIESEIVVETVA